MRQLQDRSVTAIGPTWRKEANVSVVAPFLESGKLIEEGGQIHGLRQAPEEPPALVVGCWVLSCARSDNWISRGHV